MPGPGETARSAGLPSGKGSLPQGVPQFKGACPSKNRQEAIGRQAVGNRQQAIFIILTIVLIVNNLISNVINDISGGC